MRRPHLLLCIGLALGACAVDRLLEGDVPPNARLAVSLGTPSLSVVQGAEATLTATVTRTGKFSGQISLAVDQLPPGVIATIEGQNTHDSVTSGTVRLRVGAAVTTGAYPQGARLRRRFGVG